MSIVAVLVLAVGEQLLVAAIAVLRRIVAATAVLRHIVAARGSTMVVHQVVVSAIALLLVGRHIAVTRSVLVASTGSVATISTSSTS